MVTDERSLSTQAIDGHAIGAGYLGNIFSAYFSFNRQALAPLDVS
jgi:hypothetical protein